MPKVIKETFVSLTLQPGQWKLIEGVKIRNVSSRLKQLDITIINLAHDRRVGKREKDKE